MAVDPERTLRITALALGVVALSLWLLGLVIGILARVTDVVLVFVFAWALAYLLSPPVSWIERRLRLGRFVAVLVVYVALVVGIVIALALAVPVIASQLSGFLQNAPSYGDTLAARVAELQADFRERGVQVDLTTLYGTIPERLASLAASIAKDALGVLGGALTLILDITIVAIIAFLMLVDGDQLWRKLVAALPAGLSGEADLLRRSADRSFGGYLRAQLLLGSFYGAISFLIYAVLGVPFPLLLGVVSGVLMIIPFFGAIISIFPPVLVALTQGIQLAFFTFVAVVVVQNVMLNVVAPRLMASAVGIHPLFVFAALLTGAEVAGLWGVFLALPIAGVLNVFGRYAFAVAEGRRTRAQAVEIIPEPPRSPRRTKEAKEAKT